MSAMQDCSAVRRTRSGFVGFAMRSECWVKEMQVCLKLLVMQFLSGVERKEEGDDGDGGAAVRGKHAHVKVSRRLPPTQVMAAL